MLLGIVVNGLKDDALQSRIIRNSSRFKSFSDVKTEFLEISRLIKDQSCPPKSPAADGSWRCAMEKERQGQGQR